MNEGRLGRVNKEMMGGQKIITKDRKGNGSQAKGKGKIKGANVKGLLAGTPGRDRLAIVSDKMRASHKGQRSDEV